MEGLTTERILACVKETVTPVDVDALVKGVSVLRSGLDVGRDPDWCTVCEGYACAESEQRDTSGAALDRASGLKRFTYARRPAKTGSRLRYMPIFM